MNISGPDNYPLGFNCADTSHFGQPFGYPTQPGEPLYLPEFQGGSFDGWGGSGYDNCYTMTGADFENVYYKNNIAQGATMQSYYMGVGGTNWGWLPAPQVYTSYDYGAGIRETGEIGTPANPGDITGSKFGENKLINDFETSVAPLTKTTQVAPPAPDNPAVTTMSRANTDDGTQFVYVRQSDATSTATVSTHLALNTGQTTGYTYDDTDPALSYTGTWTHAGPSAGFTSGDWDSTESYSTQAGASMSVTFTGTGDPVDRAEEHQRRHRRRVPRRHPGRDRGHLRVVRQGVPAVAVLPDRADATAATRSPSMSPASRTRPRPPTPWWSTRSTC